MTALSDEIAAYERMKNGLETDHFGQWALVHQEQLIGTYESFESAADDAVQKFGEGPYLIRQIGIPAPSLPASVLYRPVHA